MEISASLHNSLVIFICLILLVLVVFIGLKQFRLVWRQIHMIYNGQRNVVALDSAEVHDLIDTLCNVHDTIPIHPRQIRRILRKLLDANVVKDIACSKPTLHLKHPHFYKHDERKQYILKLNAQQQQQQQQQSSLQQPQKIFDFYFGVPKQYFFQLKSITKSGQQSGMSQQRGEQRKQFYQTLPTQSFMQQSHASLASQQQRTRMMMTSPLESIIGFAVTRVQPAIQRMHSSSMQLRSKSDMEDVMMMDDDKPPPASPPAASEGIEMTEMASQKQTQKATSTLSMMSLSLLPSLSQLTLQRLIPNEFVWREQRMECKDDDGKELSFDERDLESTINAIIGNGTGRRNVLQRKKGPPTKYKRRRANNADDREQKTQAQEEDDEEDAAAAATVDENEFYFCALLSYVRYPIAIDDDDGAAEREQKHVDDDDDEEEEEKKVVMKEDDGDEPDRDSGDINGTPAVPAAAAAYDMTIDENGTKYRIDDVEIALFDPPSAISKTNQISSADKKQNKSDKDKKIGGSRAKTHNVSIATALDPALHLQLLCDFRLQRLVEYYDIFGISDVDLNDAKDSSLECKICFSFPSNVVLIPCRHCCCCEACFHQIEHCPLCRTPIRQTLRWTSESDELCSP